MIVCVTWPIFCFYMIFCCYVTPFFDALLSWKPLFIVKQVTIIKVYSNREKEKLLVKIVWKVADKNVNFLATVCQCQMFVNVNCLSTDIPISIVWHQSSFPKFILLNCSWVGLFDKTFEIEIILGLDRDVMIW